MRRGVVVVLAAALVGGCTGHPEAPPGPSTGRSSTPTVSRAQRWAGDIAFLLQRMEAIHPELYHGVSSQTLHAAADGLAARVAQLDDDQVLAGVMHLVALISSNGRDGHMGVWPPDNPRWVHRFPVRLWEFPDGLFVTAARPPNEDLVGSRVMAIDGLPVEEVFARLDPVVPRDNDSNLKAARLVFLTSAEVLAGLGIARDAERMEVEVEDGGGNPRTVDVSAVDATTFADWVSGWELALPARSDMLLLRDMQDGFWIRYLAATRALYVQYNHVDPSSSDVAAAVRDALRTHAVDRMVVDVRNNGGGEAEGYDDLLDLLTGPAVDRPGRIYVLIGRLTFSAAASFAAELERRARHEVFVGEPTGGAPNFWADTVTVTLPASGLEARVSSTFEGYGRPGDPRLSIEPTVPVVLLSRDYFSGRDPVLEAALGTGSA